MSTHNAFLRIACCLFLAVSATAGDWEFDSAVRQIEQHYQTRQVRIPLMGFADFVAHVARPFGVKHFKLAVFENLPHSRTADPVEVGGFGPEWQPVVRVRNLRGGESVVIYARQIASWYKMLIVTAERHEATVMTMTMKPDRLIRYVEHVRGGD